MPESKVGKVLWVSYLVLIVPFAIIVAAVFTVFSFLYFLCDLLVSERDDSYL